MPCLGHIINLAMQALLGPTGLQAEAPERNVDYIESGEDESEEDNVDISPSNTLKKLRQGIVKIR